MNYFTEPLVVPRATLYFLTAMIFVAGAFVAWKSGKECEEEKKVLKRKYEPFSQPAQESTRKTSSQTTALVRGMAKEETKRGDTASSFSKKIQSKGLTYLELPRDAKIFIGDRSFRHNYYAQSTIHFLSKEGDTEISLPDSIRFTHVDRHYEIMGK